MLTSDVYLAAVNFIHLKDYDRAFRLLKTIEDTKFGGVDIDVIHSALGSVLLNKKNYDRAISYFYSAYDKNPIPEYAANIAQAYMFNFDPASALQVCDKAIEKFNNENCGLVKLKAASACDMLGFYERARQFLRDERGVYLGMKLMQLGDYENGTKLYAKREEQYAKMIPGYEKLRFLSGWDEAIEVLGVRVILEQGLGDCLMMMPAILELSRRGVEVTVTSLDGRHDAFVDDIVAQYEGYENIFSEKIRSSELERYKASSMIWMFDLMRNAPEIDSKCLSVEPQIAALASDLNGYVGICWRGNPDHQNDHWRSTQAEEFLPLIKSRKCISLQIGLTDREREFLGVNDVKAWDRKGLVSLAAIISNLKCVVTVDTAISHIAGVLGTPCYTMVPVNSDWRWGLTPAANKFYNPSIHHTVFQRKIGGWSDTVVEACSMVWNEH